MIISRLEDSLSGLRKIDAARAIYRAVIGKVYRSEDNNHLYFVENICLVEGNECCFLFDVTVALKERGDMGFIPKENPYSRKYPLSAILRLSEEIPIPQGSLEEDLIKECEKDITFESADIHSDFSSFRFPTS